MTRLFRQISTGKWLPIKQNANQATPGSAYFVEFARRFGIMPEDIEVVVVDTLPVDFLTNRLGKLPDPPKPMPIENDPVFRATILTILDMVNTTLQDGGRRPFSPGELVSLIRLKL